MSFPRYPVYKDSGVEWLGAVPGHWEVVRLRFTAAINPSKTELATWNRETLVSFLPMDAVGDDGTLRLDTEKPLSDVENGYTYFRNGDVTFAKITPCYENGKGALMQGLCNGVGFGTTELTVVRPHDSRLDGRYLHFVFISNQFRRLGEAQMYGAGGQKRVPDSFVRDFRTAFPPLPEQQAIAAFLDRETARIDALVAEQERLIELLREKRQAVISHAVTKGLDPSVPMKDSGVEWLGMVPGHWEVRRILDLARLESGHTPSRQHDEYWVDAECSIPWFTLADVSFLRDLRNTTISTTSQKISPLGMANSAARLLPAGTVILSRTASVGFSGITTVDLAVSQDFAAWICGGELRPRFLLLSLRGMTQEFSRLMFGATHQTIYMPDIRAFRIALPSLAEQDGIVAATDGETARIDALVAEAEHAITLLQERRSALISAAVTGQIDVRAAVTQEAS